MIGHKLQLDVLLPRLLLPLISSLELALGMICLEWLLLSGSCMCLVHERHFWQGISSCVGTALHCTALSSHADCVSTIGVTMKSQKEITLKNDLQLRDRQDIYRNFLLYCMSGDTVALPMGSTVVVERDESEFARLSQLGEILGLTQFDVANVHKELAETAYRNQV